MSALSSEIQPVPDADPRRGEAGSGRERGGRLREIDGYRALAGVLIIVFHAWQQGLYPYGHTPFAAVARGSLMGVSLFFALSGMVLYMPMARGALTGKVPSGRQFIMRRLYRLLPLYILMTVLVWAARFNGTPTDFWVLIEHLTFTQVYDKQHIFWLIGPAWTLADEMHYYVLISIFGPLLARVAARQSTLARRLAVVSLLPALLLAASLIYTTVASLVMHIPQTDSWVYFNPLARVDSFAEGMFLGILLSVPGVLAVRPRLARALSLIGFALTALLWVLQERSALVETYYYAIAGIIGMFLLLGAAMLDERQWLSKLLRMQPLTLWAKTGYSRYLVHEPLMLQLLRWHLLYFLDPIAWPISTAALIAATTFVAWATYGLVERPGQRLQRVVDDLRGRQRRAARPRPGPLPRWLPDLTLQTADGQPIGLRGLPRDRPVLVGFAADGGKRLAEQRFRLDAGEADGFYVTAEDEPAPVAGTMVLRDEHGRLRRALNREIALLEVSPGGLIIQAHAPDPGAGTAAGVV